MTGKRTGIVAANYGKEVEVLAPTGETIICELSTQLDEVPVAGDRVTYHAEGAKHYLTAVAPRARVIRRAGKRETGERIIAAHVDLALVISAVKPKLREGLIDRYLVALHHEGIEPVVVLNKIDLDDGSHAARIDVYRELGYKTFAVCATTGRGVGPLRRILHDRTAVLVGHSGVGKSTLLMQLMPDVDTAIADVSASTGKGVHTTTTAHLYTGADGVRVIDSPGIRAFGLADIGPRDVAACFPEFQPFIPDCRYRDCLHLQDEGCAVRAALAQNLIRRVRYESYVRMVRSL